MKNLFLTFSLSEAAKLLISDTRCRDVICKEVANAEELVLES